MFIRVEERRQNLIYVALNDEMRLPKTYVALKEMPSLTSHDDALLRYILHTSQQNNTYTAATSGRANTRCCGSEGDIGAVDHFLSGIKQLYCKSNRKLNMYHSEYIKAALLQEVTSN